MKLGWDHASIAALLFVFGLAYNWLVEQLERRGHDRGYTAILVVIGVAATVAATLPLIGVEAVAVLLLAFAASGTPMAAGSILRYVRERSAEEALLRQRALEELKELEEPNGDSASGGTMNALTELLATLQDVVATGDLWGHLRAWWWVVTHPHLLDEPLYL